MDYRIGDIIELINDEHGDMTVQVVKAKHGGCNGCAFRINNSCNLHDYHLEPTSCINIFRQDKTTVIFKQIK